MSRTGSPILGVSKGAPAYNTGRPNIMATFEVAPLGQAPLVRGTVSLYHDPAVFQIPTGILGEGEYRFRVRAVDGNRVSEWLPWCTFTVDTVDVPTPDVRVGAASTPRYCVSRNLVARFEVAQPGREPLMLAGNPYRVEAPQGALPAGTYQFRARFEEGDKASEWSSWCGFISR